MESIAEYDRFVVMKQNYYLRGIGMNGELLWSTSPWDAWHNPWRHNVQKVAKRVGGKMRVFNPITGRVSDRRLVEHE